jgi:hypothetical protein
MISTPALDWDACLTSASAGNSFREKYYQALDRAHAQQ